VAKEMTLSLLIHRHHLRLCHIMKKHGEHKQDDEQNQNDHFNF